jgi:hypothetical protein
MDLTCLCERRKQTLFELQCGNSDTNARSKTFRSCLFPQAHPPGPADTPTSDSVHLMRSSHWRTIPHGPAGGHWRRKNSAGAEIRFKTYYARPSRHRQELCSSRYRQRLSHGRLISGTTSLLAVRSRTNPPGEIFTLLHSPQKCMSCPKRWKPRDVHPRA